MKRKTFRHLYCSIELSSVRATQIEHYIRNVVAYKRTTLINSHSTMRTCMLYADSWIKMFTYAFTFNQTNGLSVHLGIMFIAIRNYNNKTSWLIFLLIPNIYPIRVPSAAAEQHNFICTNSKPYQNWDYGFS